MDIVPLTTRHTQSGAETAPIEFGIMPPPKCKLVDFPADRADTWVIKMDITYHATMKQYILMQLIRGANCMALITTYTDLFVVITTQETKEISKYKDSVKRDIENLRVPIKPIVEYVRPFTRMHQ